MLKYFLLFISIYMIIGIHKVAKTKLFQCFSITGIKSICCTHLVLFVNNRAAKKALEYITSFPRITPELPSTSFL